MPTFIFRGHRSLFHSHQLLSQEIRKYKPLLQPVWSAVSSFDHDFLLYDAHTILTIFCFIHINEVGANFERKGEYFSMFANSDAVAFVTLLR